MQSKPDWTFAPYNFSHAFIHFCTSFLHSHSVCWMTKTILSYSRLNWITVLLEFSEQDEFLYMIHYLTSCTFGAVLAILLRAEQKSPWQWLYPHRQHSTENDEDLPYYLLMFFFQLKLNSQVKKKGEKYNFLRSVRIGCCTWGLRGRTGQGKEGLLGLFLLCRGLGGSGQNYSCFWVLGFHAHLFTFWV